MNQTIKCTIPKQYLEQIKQQGKNSHYKVLPELKIEKGGTIDTLSVTCTKPMYQAIENAMKDGHEVTIEISHFDEGLSTYQLDSISFEETKTIRDNNGSGFLTLFTLEAFFASLIFGVIFPPAWFLTACILYKLLKD